MTELPEICCCGHAMRAHDIGDLDAGVMKMVCRDCSACPGYVGIGSFRALQMLALSDALQTAKIKVDVKVVYAPRPK